MHELHGHEVKIGNKNCKTTKKCPMCGKHMVRECVFENNKFVYVLTSILVILVGALIGTVGMLDYYGAGVLTIFVFYFFISFSNYLKCNIFNTLIFYIYATTSLF